MTFPRSPLTTRLSGSARETRARIRGIVQGRKRRAPLWLLGLAVLLPACCGALVSCQAQPVEAAPENAPAPVTVSMDSETYPGCWDETAWSRLSEEQRTLLSHLPVDELPREPVDLFDVQYGSAWQDTLIPLAQSQDGEVVLYGVVICEKALPEEEESVAVYVEDCGILLRWGEKTAYYPLSWFTNLHYAFNPWLEVSDFDQDGQKEAAVCLTWGHGTGAWAESLYLFEQDTLEYTVPNCGALSDISCTYDSSAHTATLSARDYSLTVPLSEYIEPLESIYLGGQVRFSCDDGQLICEMGYDFSGILTGFLVTGRAPVLWQDGMYQLGDITLYRTS